jgi:glycosyltransferase involved in cell wall biosynthesis
MRVMMLVPVVPKRLDSTLPWHFFQELRPLVSGGLQLCVVSTVQPEYTLQGIQFFRLALPPIRNSLREVLPTLHLASRYPSMLPKGHKVFDRSVLRMCRWNCKLSDLINEWRPDVLHSHWAFPAGSGGYLAARQHCVPLVMTLRGIDHQIVPQFNYGDCLNQWYEGALACALEYAGVVTVCCSDSLRRLQAIGVKDPAKIRTVYHAIDADRFEGSVIDSNVFRSRLGIREGRIVSCVAFMDSGRKGHATLMKAFSEVKRNYRDTTLLLVGDGRERRGLESLAKGLGIGDAVVFAGSMHPNEIDHVMRISTCTVLPSYSEAFANVVFESLIAGTPVISSAVGTPKDVLSENEFGLLFPAGDVGKLTHCLRDVLDDEVKYRKMASRGGGFVRGNMSLAKRVAAFTSIYQELLDWRSTQRTYGREREDQGIAS